MSHSPEMLLLLAAAVASVAAQSTSSAVASSSSTVPSSSSAAPSSTSAAPTPTPTHHKHHKLSGGAIAGIVVGCVVFVALLLGLCGGLLFKSRKSKKTEPAPSYEPKHEQREIQRPHESTTPNLERGNPHDTTNDYTRTVEQTGRTPAGYSGGAVKAPTTTAATAGTTNSAYHTTPTGNAVNTSGPTNPVTAGTTTATRNPTHEYSGQNTGRLADGGQQLRNDLHPGVGSGTTGGSVPGGYTTGGASGYADDVRGATSNMPGSYTQGGSGGGLSSNVRDAAQNIPGSYTQGGGSGGLGNSVREAAQNIPGRGYGVVNN